MALFRVYLILFVGLSIIYLALSFYARAGARKRLEAEWDRGGIDMPRPAYVRHGLAAFDSSLRPKLILGVYVVPMVLVGVIIYVVNIA